MKNKVSGSVWVCGVGSWVVGYCEMGMVVDSGGEKWGGGDFLGGGEGGKDGKGRDRERDE